MSNQGGSQGPSGGAVANAKRRAAALAKLSTPIGEQDYPFPAPVRRSALVAPLSLQPVPSRLQRAAGNG